MDFFKVKKFRKTHKPNLEKDSKDKPVPQHQSTPRAKCHPLNPSFLGVKNVFFLKKK